MRLTKDNLIALKELFKEGRWVLPSALSGLLYWVIEGVSEGDTWGSILIAILVFPIFIHARFWLCVVKLLFNMVSPILIVSIVVSLFKLNILAACGLAFLSYVLNEICKVIVDTYDLETIVERDIIRCGKTFFGAEHSDGYYDGYDAGFKRAYFDAGDRDPPHEVN